MFSGPLLVALALLLLLVEVLLEGLVAQAPATYQAYVSVKTMQSELNKLQATVAILSCGEVASSTHSIHATSEHLSDII